MLFLNGSLQLLVIVTSTQVAIVFAEQYTLKKLGSKKAVFKLADMAELYSLRLQQLGVTVTNEKRMHTTRLKQRLLARFPDMLAQSKGRDVLLVFDEDVGYALGKACEQDTDNDAVHLARAAQIVRRHMFDPNTFTGSFKESCEFCATLAASTSKYGNGRPEH